MSLGALAFLVGNQIGKTQKSTYERNLEEEKKKEERKIQAQINQELRQFDLDILKEQEKAKIDIAKQKELGIFKVTEEKTAGILTDLMMLDEETAVIQARKLAELEVINKEQLKYLEKELALRNKYKLEYEGSFTNILMGREQQKSDINIEEQKQISQNQIANVFAGKVAELKDTTYQNMVLDNKIKFLKAEGIAKGKVEILNKLAEYSNTELQDLINEVSAGKITSDTAAQGKANTVALIEKLGNNELQALELLISNNKIISDSKATSTARIAAMKAELGDKELQRLLLSAKKDEITQGYTLKLEDDMLRLTNDDYQALLNSTNASRILSEQAAKDQAMINTLGNEDLQNILATAKTREELRAGEVELVLEMQKLGNKKLQSLLIDAAVDKERAIGIVNNVLALDLYEGKARVDSEIAQQQKAIEEVENIESSITVVTGMNEDNGEPIETTVNFYKNFKDELNGPLNHFENMVESGDFDDIMEFGSDSQKQKLANELYSATTRYINDTKDINPTGESTRIVLGEFSGLTNSSAAEDIVTKAQMGDGIRSVQNFSINNGVSTSNILQTQYVQSERIKKIFSLESKETVDTYNALQTFRINEGLTTQDNLDAGEELKFVDRKILKFYQEFLKPDESMIGQAGFQFSDLKLVRGYLSAGGDPTRMQPAIRKKILTAGRAAGFTNAEQYIIALGAGIGTGKKAGQTLNYRGRQEKLTAFGIDVVDVNAKNTSSSGLIRTLKSFISTYPDEDINPFRNEAQAKELLEGVTADPDATALGGKPLSVVTLIASKLPNATHEIFNRLGITFETKYDQNGSPTVEATGGNEQGFFEGYSQVLQEGKIAGFGNLNLNNNREEIQAELDRQLRNNTKLMVDLAGRLGKRPSEITVEEYYQAEVEARQRNQNAYNASLLKYQNSAEGSDSRIQAKRDLLKFVIAYQYASLLQGGTGGRTISDQDVENMLTALAQGEITEPQGAITSALEVLKQASLQNEITTAYLSGDDSQIAGAYFFERELATQVNFMYTDSSSARNKIRDASNPAVNAATGGVSGQAFGFVDGKITALGKADLAADAGKGTTVLEFQEKIRKDYADGKRIKITPQILDAFPELKGKEGFEVGATMFKPTVDAGT
jgi:hypothetical protein